MAKKKMEEPVIEMTPNLVISKMKFKELLEAQIERGSEISKMTVQTQQQGGYGVYGGFGGVHVEYNEEQKAAFFNVNSRWNERNLELLKRSFDNPNNRYSHEYENIYSIIITSDTDIVAEEKDHIGRKVNLLKSIIENLDLITSVVPDEEPISKSETNNDEFMPESIFEDNIFDVNPHSCFVIMPFRDELNKFYNDIIKPTAMSIPEMQCLRADEIYDNKAIIDDIWEGINEAKVLIADLTGRNANVFYELGLAHARGKEVILIAQTEDDIPFDLLHLRHIIYSLNYDGVDDFKDKLKKTIEKVIKHK